MMFWSLEQGGRIAAYQELTVRERWRRQYSWVDFGACSANANVYTFRVISYDYVKINADYRG